MNELLGSGSLWAIRSDHEYKSDPEADGKGHPERELLRSRCNEQNSGKNCGNGRKDGVREAIPEGQPKKGRCIKQHCSKYKRVGNERGN